MRLGLILCAFGLHRWYNYCCRNRGAERDTQRECGRCSVIQWRETRATPWRET